MPAQTYTLLDPANGNLALKIFLLEDNTCFDHIQRLNYYSLIWIKKGSGILKADFSDHEVRDNRLFAFAPYQPFMLQTEEKLNGIVLHFHSDFFCIHKHQEEVACNGVLFNNIYEPPFVEVTEAIATNFDLLILQMKTEMQQTDLAQNELLISYLKIFLINASRLKVQQHVDSADTKQMPKEPFILQNLKTYIEQYFKSKHSASDYAALLHISTKALARITKTHFNKTLTDLIAERIVIEAKRELYLTNKPVKEIARDLGYDDEYYFSRFFKIQSDVSPQAYRETVGFARATA